MVDLAVASPRTMSHREGHVRDLGDARERLLGLLQRRLMRAELLVIGELEIVQFGVH